MCIHSEQELHSRQFHAKNFTHPFRIARSRAIQPRSFTVRSRAIHSASDILRVIRDIRQNPRFRNEFHDILTYSNSN